MEEHYGKIAGVFLDGEQVGLLRQWRLVIENRATATAGRRVRRRGSGWRAYAREWLIKRMAQDYVFRFVGAANYYEAKGRIVRKGEMIELEGGPPIKAIFP